MYTQLFTLKLRRCYITYKVIDPFLLQFAYEMRKRAEEVAKVMGDPNDVKVDVAGDPNDAKVDIAGDSKDAKVDIAGDSNDAKVDIAGDPKDEIKVASDDKSAAVEVEGATEKAKKKGGAKRKQKVILFVCVGTSLKLLYSTYLVVRIK